MFIPPLCLTPGPPPMLHEGKTKAEQMKTKIRITNVIT